MIIVTWTARALMAAIAVAWGVIGARTVREKWRRAGRVIDEAVENVNRRIAASIAADEARALMCDPCHGKAGRCTCTGKCSNWLCGADDTGIDRAEFDRELAEWLRGDGGRG
jgi:hypothetical protein